MPRKRDYVALANPTQATYNSNASDITNLRFEVRSIDEQCGGNAYMQF